MTYIPAAEFRARVLPALKGEGLGQYSTGAIDEGWGRVYVVVTTAVDCPTCSVAPAPAPTPNQWR
ncbi:hypothetical protein [Dietzia psychralcaliphila]|uniref:hypothetical protein n=1 Tax=Dietzia psychralcaliphila TaxID=139021 RepID=UPI000D30FD73|nr:hypothetical protein [Dietzia psychralcaliphila]